MRRVPARLTLAALILVPACAPAADLDEDLAKLADVRAKQAELKKAEDGLVEKLRRAHADNHAKLVAAGVVAPGPPPPAPPPRPVDPLVQKLRDAFAADAGTRDQALHLAELYRQAVALARDPAVPSTAALLEQVRVAAKSVLKDFGPDTLAGVRRAVQAELAAALGKVDAEPLTDAERAAAAALFGRLAEILEGL